MKRESEPEEPVEAIAAPASSVMGQGKPPPPPLAVPGQDGPQQMPSDNFYPQEYPYHYGDEYYHPQHHRGYHSHPYSAPIYMSSVPTTPQHMSTTPSCAQCERCAQRDRDYDRLQELLVLQGGAGAAAAARTKQDSGGNNMGTTAEGLEKELESPRKDKPDAELIWDGTTWDAFPFLFMCCAPVCIPCFCAAHLIDIVTTVGSYSLSVRRSVAVLAHVFCTQPTLHLCPVSVKKYALHMTAISEGPCLSYLCFNENCGL